MTAPTGAKESPGRGGNRSRAQNSSSAPSIYNAQVESATNTLDIAPTRAEQARQKAARRQSELVTLALYRNRRGLSNDHDAFLLAVSINSIATPAGRYRLKRHGKAHWSNWSAVDVVVLGDASRRAGFAPLDLHGSDGDALREIIARASIEAHQGNYSGSCLGTLVSLTLDERRSLGITTLSAIDESAEERRQWVAERKRERDRERQQKRRQGQHQPREQWLAENSLTRSRPWEALGISRATYYRKNHQIELRTDVSQSLQSRATNLSQHSEDNIATDQSQIAGDGTATDQSHLINEQGQKPERGLSLPSSIICEATYPSHTEDYAEEAPETARRPATEEAEKKLLDELLRQRRAARAARDVEAERRAQDGIDRFKWLGDQT